MKSVTISDVESKNELIRIFAEIFHLSNII